MKKVLIVLMLTFGMLVANESKATDTGAIRSIVIEHSHAGCCWVHDAVRWIKSKV